MRVPYCISQSFYCRNLDAYSTQDPDVENIKKAIKVGIVILVYVIEWTRVVTTQWSPNTGMAIVHDRWLLTVVFRKYLYVIPVVLDKIECSMILK